MEGIGSYSEYIQNKHRRIYQRYLEMIRQEQEENPLRAEHIGKSYYAKRIAEEQTPPMDPMYILRVINNMLRSGHKG